MREVTDSFLLGLSGVSATLLGTFTLGLFFYLNSALHFERGMGAAADHYMRSSARWVFASYSIPLFVPLVLVGVGPGWGALAFGLMCAALGAATVDTTRRILAKGATRMSPTIAVNEVGTTLLVILLTALPWALGGSAPARSAFVPSLLLALVASFTSTATLVMHVFDRAQDDMTEDDGRRSSGAP